MFYFSMMGRPFVQSDMRTATNDKLAILPWMPENVFVCRNHHVTVSLIKIIHGIISPYLVHTWFTNLAFNLA
jgi:hypothetical protein